MISEFWLTRVHRVMNYVRDNPANDMWLEDLAAVAHSSPYHFHRIFKAVTGETVSAFARRARLERAAYLMKARPTRALSDIALEVGYPALAEFSRAFKHHYGLPPSQWNRRTHLNQVPQAVMQIERENSPSFQVEIRTHEPSYLIYVRMKTWFQVEVLKVGYKRLTEFLSMNGVDWRNCPLVGMSWDHYETTPLESVHYDLGFVLTQPLEANSPFSSYQLPAFQAVHAHCSGGLQVVAQAWNHLYNNWFPASRFEPRDLPAMKWFRQRPDQIGWHHWDLDCVIALSECTAP